MVLATPPAASCGSGGSGGRSSTPRRLFTIGGGSAAKATCASPGTPLSAVPFEFDPIITVDAAAAQRRAMKRATERAAAEHAAASSPPLAKRSPNASAKPAAAVAEVVPAVQNFRQEVAALILQAEALRQRKVKVERLKADLRLKADQTDRSLDAALQAAVRQRYAHRQWEEMRRVACQLWEADCPPETGSQLSVRRELDATSKLKHEADRRLVSAQERATAAEKVLLEKKVAEAEAKAAAAETMLRASEKQRDKAIAYMVGQAPLEKQVAEAKAEAAAAEELLRTSERQRDRAIAYMVDQQPLQKAAAAAEAKAAAAEEMLEMSETQRDTALAYLVDKGAIAYVADKEAGAQEAGLQGAGAQEAGAQERRREGRQQQAREQLAAARGEEKLERQRREARERAAEAQEVATPSTQFVDCRIRRVAAASSPLSGTGADRQRRPRSALVSMEPVALNSALALTYRQLKSM